MAGDIDWARTGLLAPRGSQQSQRQRNRRQEAQRAEAEWSRLHHARRIRRRCAPRRRSRRDITRIGDVSSPDLTAPVNPHQEAHGHGERGGVSIGFGCARGTQRAARQAGLEGRDPSGGGRMTGRHLMPAPPPDSRHVQPGAGKPGRSPALADRSPSAGYTGPCRRRAGGQPHAPRCSTPGLAAGTPGTLRGRRARQSDLEPAGRRSRPGFQDTPCVSPAGIPGRPGKGRADGGTTRSRPACCVSSMTPRGCAASFVADLRGGLTPADSCAPDFTEQMLRPSSASRCR
jgi:hypothetical protein